MFAVAIPVVVDPIDVADIIDRIDVNALIEKVDIDAVLSRVDLNGLPPCCIPHTLRPMYVQVTG